MKRIFYVSFLFLTATPLLAQDEALSYEPVEDNSFIVARDLSETTDDHLIIGYDYHSSTIAPPVAGIMKTDLSGDVMWSKLLEIPESAADCSFEVIENADGNYYFWGLSKHGGTLEMRAILSEISADGEMLWSKEYNFGVAIESAYTVNKLQVMPSGNLQMMIAISDRVIVIKTDATGEIIWGKSSSVDGLGFGGKNPGFEWLAIPDDGGMCASKAGTNFSLLRYSADGELLWNKAYEIGSYTHGKTLVKSPNGNVLVAGFINNTAHIMEIDELTGEINWVKRFDDKLMYLESAAHLHVIGDEVILDFITHLKEHYVVVLNADGEVLKTLLGKNTVYDYNKIEFTDNKHYIYGADSTADGFLGFVNISDNLLEGSCLFDKVQALSTSNYTAYDEIEFDPLEEDFTNQADMAIGLNDFTIQKRFICESILTVEEDELVKISVYPNPSSDFLTLSVSEDLLNATYTLTDLSGKTVIQNKVSASLLTIDVTDLIQGQYILTVQNNDQLLTEKVTIIR